MTDTNIHAARRPAITFILCARNDNYMGNPVGRLQIALNYLGEKLRVLGKENEAEVIVTDWGSQVPLRTVLELNEAAARITRFLEVSPALAQEQQRDSPFAEVLALNAAVRRANGRYIGRIDQDTLVGERFLRSFFAWDTGAADPGVSLERTFLFSRRRQIPFRFAVSEPTLSQVDALIRRCGRVLEVETLANFYYSPVGIMLLHRNLWEECGGYDERLIYWGWMEIDLAHRIRSKYPLVDLGLIVGHDFYHLEHYDPRTPRRTPRKLNPTRAENLDFFPNNGEWGLVGRELALAGYTTSPRPAPAARAGQRQPTRRESALFLPGAIVTAYLSVPWRFLSRGALSSWKTAAKFARAIGRPGRYPEYSRRLLRFAQSRLTGRGQPILSVTKVKRKG